VFIESLAKVLFALLWEKGLIFIGERENTKPFPLSPSPFPDFCKKSIVAVGQYFHYRPGQKFRHHQQLQDLALFHHFGERKISTNELKY